MSAMNKPFQREGSESNAHVGKDFENRIRLYFASQGVNLVQGFNIEIGINGHKFHKFDFGDEHSKIIVECKSHRWTKGKNVPSAKMAEWNEAMFLFFAAPKDYRKILFVSRDYSAERDETLANYYVRTYSHLIPEGVEIWEFDEVKGAVEKVK